MKNVLFVREKMLKIELNGILQKYNVKVNLIFMLIVLN